MDGLSNVVIDGYDATLQQYGSAGASEFNGLEIYGGSSHIRVLGLTFSQAGLTTASTDEQTHQVQLGDASTGVDDIQFVDCTWLDDAPSILGTTGDGLRLLGGNSEATAITRLSVLHSRIDGSRDGMDFQHGTSMVDTYGNYFGPMRTLGFHHEATSPGGNNYETTLWNTFYTPNGVDSISLSGDGILFNNDAHADTFSENLLPNGLLFALATHQIWANSNVIVDADATSSGNEVWLSEFNADDTWLDGNTIVQAQTPAGSAQAPDNILFQYDNGIAPIGVWIEHNFLGNYACAASVSTECGGAVIMNAVRDAWIDENTITYNGSFNTSNGFECVSLASFDTLNNGTTPGISRGFVERNQCVKGLQSNGSAAGNIYIGFLFQGMSLQFDIGHGTFRDNVLIGAVDGFDAEGDTTYPSTYVEGAPLLSGNQFSSVTSQNLPIYYTLDSTNHGEQLAGSGALSPSKAFSLLVTDGLVDSYTLYDGTYDGEVKTVNINNTLASNGTLSFYNNDLGDGTVHTITWLAASGTAEFSLTWDAGAGVWWVLETNNVTVN
jgi:hypothetical protein